MAREDEITAAKLAHGRRLTANRYRWADVTAGRLHLHVTRRRRCAAARYVANAEANAALAGADHAAVIIHVTESAQWLAIITLEELLGMAKLAGLLPASES